MKDIFDYLEVEPGIKVDIISVTRDFVSLS